MPVTHAGPSPTISIDIPPDERLDELMRDIEDTDFIMGPLDVRDLISALKTLKILRVVNKPYDPMPWTSSEGHTFVIDPRGSFDVANAISFGLVDAADVAGDGPLKTRLMQAALAIDCLVLAVKSSMALHRNSHEVHKTCTNALKAVGAE